jgi:phospho-N-acetylmuramoyl-pentapeptide-transferase
VIALLIASSVAMAVSLVGTRFLITFFRRRGQGQPILGPEDRGPAHQHKAGTPTMGGIAVLFSATVGYFVAHLRKGAYFSDQTLFIMGGIAVMAALGFLDDFLKVRRAHNRGVLWKKKGWITLAMSFLIATVLVCFTEIDTRIGLTRADLPGWELGKVGWVIWAGLIIFSTVNAVNVTDGLDGLAAGSALFGFFAFTIIAFWGLRNRDLYPFMVNPFDLSILAVALAGACIGFLWWNAAPARIIMGDVGALGLGAALALLALSTNTSLLLPLVCLLNVIEIGSVAVQMGTYKLLNKRRIFRMSPVHHHFELVGWPETTVVIRFWIIAGIGVAMALGLFYADFARQIGVA